jgi:uncharacterized protein YdhG (YjbR/CyaY superfamily)
MPNAKPKTVDEYIKVAPKGAQKHLHEIRKILKQVSPKATEAIKWGYPVLEEGRILFSFSAHKTHLNFMPTRSTLEQFKDELADYKTGRDTIQFAYDKPLPKNLIVKLAKYRIKEVREGALWMHGEKY